MQLNGERNFDIDTEKIEKKNKNIHKTVIEDSTIQSLQLMIEKYSNDDDLRGEFIREIEIETKTMSDITIKSNLCKTIDRYMRDSF